VRDVDQRVLPSVPPQLVPSIVRIALTALCLFSSATIVAGQTTPLAKGARASQLAPANLPGPLLKLVDSSKVSKTNDAFEAPAVVFAGPGGQVLVASGNYGGQMKLFDSTGRRLWTIEGYRDVAVAAAAGWIGSNVWIYDPGHSQVAIIDRGEVSKSVELPDWVRPKFSQRKTFPVFASFTVYGYREDGSLFVVPREPHSIVGTSGYDEKTSYLVKVTDSGIIEQTIAKFPSLEYARRNSPGAQGGGNRYDATVSSMHWPILRVSPGGERSVVVTSDTLGGKSDTVSIAAYDEKGRLLFSRKLPFPSKVYTDAERDSVAKDRFNRMSFQQRERATRGLSKRAAAVSDVVLGRDNTVWVSLRTSGVIQPIVGFDANGQPLGTLNAPANFQLKAADRGVLFGASAKDRSQRISRYTIGRL
jgi:hypothetical protein